MLTARILGVRLTRFDHLSARSRSLFVREAITGAIERFDSIELRIDLPEFAPDALDVAVYGAIVDIDVVLISGIHQLVARLHDAGALRQRLEDQELGDGQRHVDAAPRHAVPRRV